MTTTEAPAAPTRSQALGVSLRIVGAAVLVGAATIGVLSRLAMHLLARLNPEATGLTSDDGFEMGRFTLSGSLNLMVVGLAFGLLSGVLYLLLEPLLIGPGWFRTLSLSVGAGTVAATQLVHSDGVDFRLLEPLALAVAMFVLLPMLHIALVERWAVRIRRVNGAPARQAGPTIGWILRGLLAVWFVFAVASVIGDVQVLTDVAG